MVMEILTFIAILNFGFNVFTKTMFLVNNVRPKDALHVRAGGSPENVKTHLHPTQEKERCNLCACTLPSVI